MEAEVGPQACLRVANVKSLLTVLQSVKPSNSKQECVITMGLEDGMRLQLEDESKTLQSHISLRPDLFTLVESPEGRQQFGLQWALLVDTLAVFASLGGAELELRYPGPNHELVFEMVEEADSTVCTYARIATTDTQVPTPLTDYWREPSSSFIISGVMLKEAVDDLEWAATGGAATQRGTCQLRLGRHPRSLVLRASGAGSLEVDFPTDEDDNVHGFACTADEVMASYKHKHLKAAFCSIPHHVKDYLGEISTKVSIDPQGLMKVTHMIGMRPGAPAHSSRPPGTQGAGFGNAVVTFVLLPEEDEDDA